MGNPLSHLVPGNEEAASAKKPMAPPPLPNLNTKKATAPAVTETAPATGMVAPPPPKLGAPAPPPPIPGQAGLPEQPAAAPAPKMTVAAPPPLPNLGNQKATEPAVKVPKLPEGGKIPKVEKPKVEDEKADKPEVEMYTDVPPFLQGVLDLKEQQETAEAVAKVAAEVTPKAEAPKVSTPTPPTGTPLAGIPVPEAQQAAPSPFTSGNSSSPFGNAAAVNPFSTGNGKGNEFVIKLPKNPTKELQALYDSGIAVKDMSQDQLRVCYYQLGASNAPYIYSATTVNHIAKKGKHPDDTEREDSDWLFIGSAVHEAAETKGASLKKLFYFDGDTIPEMPDEYKKLSADHRKIAEAMIKDGLSDMEAYMKVKDTAAVRKVKPEWLVEGYVFECDKDYAVLQGKIDALYEEQDHNPDAPETIVKDIADLEKQRDKIKDSADKKAVAAVAKSAATEYDKIKGGFPKIKAYFDGLEKYEAKKAIVRERAAKVDGSVVIDDLGYMKQRGFRAYQSIAKTYGAFANNKDAFNIYHPDNVSSNKFEMFSEYVILYDYQLPTGKKVLFKSMIDRIVVDHTAKQIWVIDLKTHGQADFLGNNYVGHAYWRSMSVYYHAVEVEAKRRGWDGYQIICSILPVSMVSLEVGVYGVSLLNLAPEEISLGTHGGYVKPEWFDFFDDHKRVCYALPEKAMEHMLSIGAMSVNSPRYKRRGWKKVVEDFEMSSVPTNMRANG